MVPSGISWHKIKLCRDSEQSHHQWGCSRQQLNHDHSLTHTHTSPTSTLIPAVFQLWEAQIGWLSARRPCQPTVPEVTGPWSPSVQSRKEGEVSAQWWIQALRPQGGLKEAGNTVQRKDELKVKKREKVHSQVEMSDQEIGCLVHKPWSCYCNLELCKPPWPSVPINWWAYKVDKVANIWNIDTEN